MNWTPVAPCEPVCQLPVAKAVVESIDVEKPAFSTNLAWAEEEHRLKRLFLEHEHRIVQAVVRSINERGASSLPETSYSLPQMVLQADAKSEAPRSNLKIEVPPPDDTCSRQGTSVSLPEEASLPEERQPDEIYNLPGMALLDDAPAVETEIVDGISDIMSTGTAGNQIKPNDHLTNGRDADVAITSSQRAAHAISCSAQEYDALEACDPACSVESGFAGVERGFGDSSPAPTPSSARGRKQPSRFSKYSSVGRSGSDIVRNKWTLAQQEQNLDKASKLSRMASSLTNGHEDGLEGKAQHFAFSLLEARFFQFAIMLTILASAVSVGMQADFAIKHAPKAVPWQIILADRIFAVCFAIELAFRILAEASTFLQVSNKNLTWNILDTFLVVFSIAEQVMLTVQKTTSPDMSILRTLRIFRLMRVFRVVRVARFFNDMRVMVAGIMDSMKLLVWALILLLIIAFIFAVCVLELVSLELDVMHEHPERFDVSVEDLRQDIELSWGSLIRAMYALFGSISGGLNWAAIVEPLITVNPMIAVLFVFYISMAVFCVLNIVTGIFVENAKKMTAKDETNLTMDTIEQKQEWLEEVRTLWKSITTEETSEIDMTTFVNHAQDVKVQALFHRLGLDIQSEYLPGLFALLDYNDSGKVDIDEFAVGIQMLHGQAKSIDVARIRHNVAVVRQELVELREFLSNLLAEKTSQEETVAPNQEGSAVLDSPQGD